jgi:hypothetical protein
MVRKLGEVSKEGDRDVRVSMVGMCSCELGSEGEIMGLKVSNDRRYLYHTYDLNRIEWFQ